MRAALLRYRVMADVVGVLLVILVCVGVPLEHLTRTGTAPQHAGEVITEYLGVAHGFLYMAFLVTGGLLAKAARLSLWYTIGHLALGTVPFVSFYAERRVTARVRGRTDSPARARARAVDRPD